MKYCLALPLLLFIASTATAFPAPIISSESASAKKVCMVCEITCGNAPGSSFLISAYQESGCPTPGENFHFVSGSSTIVQCEPVSSSAEHAEGDCICPFTPCEVKVRAVGS